MISANKFIYRSVLVGSSRWECFLFHSSLMYGVHSSMILKKLIFRYCCWWWWWFKRVWLSGTSYNNKNTINSNKTIVRDSKVCIYNDINVKKCIEFNGKDRKTAKKQKSKKTKINEAYYYIKDQCWLSWLLIWANLCRKWKGQSARERSRAWRKKMYGIREL